MHWDSNLPFNIVAGLREMIRKSTLHRAQHTVGAQEMVVIEDYLSQSDGDRGSNCPRLCAFFYPRPLPGQQGPGPGIT